MIFYNRVFTLLIISIFCIGTSLTAQKVTKVSGKILDKTTNEPLIFVDLNFQGTNVAASSDGDGFFNIETRFPSDTLVISYIGYEPIKFYVKEGTRTRKKFYMVSEGLQLETVNIKAKKAKYSKKNNPAVELIKKVIASKDKNTAQETEYFSYEQYEKVRLDINNITDKFKERRFINDFDFLWKYIDTSEVNGRTFLPVFMREILSTQYYKKSSDTHKEYRKALNYSKINDELDANSLNSIIDLLYTDVDIYDDRIDLLENNFLSPASKFGINFYRYYIVDTVEIDGQSLINLNVIPEDKGDFGFYGTLSISNDERNAIMSADLGILNGINLNFVRDIRLKQEFKFIGDKLYKTGDEVIVDYALVDNGIGAYGSRVVSRDDFSFELPDREGIFGYLNEVILADDYDEHTEDFWQERRLVELDKNDQQLFEMLDTLRNNRRYQAYVTGIGIFTTGYIPFKKFDIGKVSDFANYNQVEGWNARVGLSTNEKFSNKLRIRGTASYAFGTDNFKYFGQGVYSFNKKWKRSPKHEVKITVEEASTFPGQELDLISPENIALSIRRGETTRMLLNHRYEASYLKEKIGFSYELGAKYISRQGIGTLDFPYFDESVGATAYLDDINTFETFAQIRYAPNEQFLQGKDTRVQLQNEFPIVTFRYGKGFNTILDGNYNYHKLNLSLFKQIEWSLIGTTNFNVEAGKIFGELPYIINFIPRGNQTYAYQLTSYNLMNFMEFVADRFVSLQFEHYFYGYFLNNVPLIRRLKLREVISLKAYYGGISDKNNPALNPDLVQFSTDENGNARTYIFGDEPYLEASLGFSNIFKVFRVDLVQRLTYLDNLDVPQLFGQKGLAVRFRTQVEF